MTHSTSSSAEPADAATRLAVLGSPIAHSKSPAIHAAAYRALGLPWSYEAIEQRQTTVAGFLDTRDATWRGFSVTAPLKHHVHEWATTVDAASALTGASNTVLLANRRAWNTDVDGTVAAFVRAGTPQAATGLILGAGATALSTFVALHRLGCTSITIALREQAKAARLVALGEQLNVKVQLVALSDKLPRSDVAVSTLPAHAAVVPSFAEPPAALLDADYADGESRFRATLGARVIPGIEMLLEQALLQVRIFVHGDASAVLSDEPAVAAAMRAAAL